MKSPTKITFTDGAACGVSVN